MGGRGGKKVEGQRRYEIGWAVGRGGKKVEGQRMYEIGWAVGAARR